MAEDPWAIDEWDIRTAPSEAGRNTQTRRWDTTVGYSHRAGPIHPAGIIADVAARLG